MESSRCLHGVFTASSRRPHGHHSDATELQRRFNERLTEFGMRFYVVLCASAVIYGTHTALSRRSHCAKIKKLRKSAMHTQYKRVETPYNLLTRAVEFHRLHLTFLLRIHGAPVRCRRCYWVVTASFLRSHCALIRTPSDGLCFEHAQHACRWSAFYAMPLRC
jgi:hypothetical protein